MVGERVESARPFTSGPDEEQVTVRLGINETYPPLEVYKTTAESVEAGVNQELDLGLKRMKVGSVFIKTVHNDDLEELGPNTVYIQQYTVNTESLDLSDSEVNEIAQTVKSLVEELGYSVTGMSGEVIND